MVIITAIWILWLTNQILSPGLELQMNQWNTTVICLKLFGVITMLIFSPPRSNLGKHCRAHGRKLFSLEHVAPVPAQPAYFCQVLAATGNQPF